MIDIHLVCARDAVTFAESLMRLLAAEGHQCRMSCGRMSSREIPQAQMEDDAVLLIWSYDAAAQEYMLDWLEGIDPSRLVEVSRAPGAPELRGRKAVPIDFANWRGERGARAWHALTDRIEAVERALTPAPPSQKRAAIGVAAASVVAVGVALTMRVTGDGGDPTAVIAPTPLPPAHDVVAVHQGPSEGWGGALEVEEPASGEDLRAPTLSPRVGQVSQTNFGTLAQTASVFHGEIRDPTLIERVGELNPLRLVRLTR